MERKLKVSVKIKEHGSDLIEDREMFMVIMDDDNLEELIQMHYGSWYDIIEYSSHPIDIYISTKYCSRVHEDYLRKEEEQ